MSGLSRNYSRPSNNVFNGHADGKDFGRNSGFWREVMFTFLSRVSILTRDIDIANLSVCLSVRNVPVSDENGITYRHSFFHHTVEQSF